MQHRVNASPAAGDRLLRFEDLERGVAVGLWVVAVDGYEWRHDLEQVDFPKNNPHPDRGPWLVPKGDIARRYGVLRRPGLLEGFVQLAADPSPTRIRSFANRFGLLGREAYLLPAGAKSGVLNVAGESLNAWTNACLEFRDVWTTWQAVATLRDRDARSAGAVQQAERLLHERIIIDPGHGGARYASEQKGPGKSAIEHRRWLSHPDARVDTPAPLARMAQSRDYVGLAGWDVARQVNEHLKGMNPQVHALRHFALRFAPDSLETAIWFAFALAMSGEGGREIPCSNCGNAFIQTRSNRRFCSPHCQAASAYRERIRRATSPQEP